MWVKMIESSKKNLQIETVRRYIEYNKINPCCFVFLLIQMLCHDQIVTWVISCTFLNQFSSDLSSNTAVLGEDFVAKDVHIPWQRAS